MSGPAGSTPAEARAGTARRRASIRAGRAHRRRRRRLVWRAAVPVVVIAVLTVPGALALGVAAVVVGLAFGAVALALLGAATGWRLLRRHPPGHPPEDRARRRD